MFLYHNLLIRCNCRVGIELPTVEVRFSDLSVEAECEVVHGKPIPTLWNSVKGILSVSNIKCVCYIDLEMEGCSRFHFTEGCFSVWLIQKHLMVVYRSSSVQRKKPR